MRSLRGKLLLSYTLLVLGILAVGAWSIYHFGTLGRSVGLILRNNYRSVVDAQVMKEALERQDSAMLFYIAGETAKATSQYEANHVRFARAYADAADNITEVGESDVIRDIGAQFEAYTQRARVFLNERAFGASERRRMYFSDIEPAFLRLKNLCDDLLNLNQEAMVRAQGRAEREAAAARQTAVLIALGAVLLGAFYAVSLSRALVAPLRELASAAERIGEGRLDTRIDARGRDEVSVLATAFNGMTARLRDYREREAARLQVAEEKSDAVLNSLYEPVIVTGPQGDVDGLNRAASNVLGQADNWTGQPVERFGLPPIAAAVREAITKRSPVAPEGDRGVTVINFDGGGRSYRVRTAPVIRQSGDVAGTVTVLEDVTRLRQVDRLKDEFISVASHELRTPLTSIQLALNLLAEGSAGPLAPQQARLVNMAATDANRLERLTRDLLDLTRLEAGTVAPNRTPAHPRDIVAAAMESLQIAAKEKGVTLVVAVDPSLPQVLADVEQLARVITNLVDNAIRHTGADGRIDVTARASGDMVCFAVADTGAGIPSEYLPRIFDRFVQVPGATAGGAGLGLSIARKIVEAHRGAITVESVVGRGTTFSFSIPVATKHANPGTEGQTDDLAHPDHRR
jgi:signal transduction histidine kinase